MIKRCLLLLCSFTLVALPCMGTTNIFTVTNTLPAGAGSLSNAIALANNSSASSTNLIQFNILPFDGTVKTIAPTASLPLITRRIIIDGYTQPGASANTLANGDNARLLIELNGAAASASGLTIIGSGSGSTIRGLSINRCVGDGIYLNGPANCVIEGNFIGTDPTGMLARTNLSHGVELGGAVMNRIGGTNAAARNVLSGNFSMGVMMGGDCISNLVQGNFIGLDVTGANALPNRNEGIRIVGGGSTGNLVGGASASARNIISGNINDGVSVTFGPFGNVVQGNYVGTDVTGTQPLGNLDGVQLSANGSNSVLGNVVCANRRHGVVVESAEVNSVVQGNLIGVDATGANALGNAFDGVLITDGIGTTIGGTNVGDGNIIAHNGAVGVSVYYDDAVNNAILGNTIFDNSKLGIDLRLEDGVSPDDPTDTDLGPNKSQNFPIITSVGINGGNVTLSGVLNSIGNSSYRLEFFSNPSCDASGNGEGQNFLGFTNVTTDGSGNAEFALALANPFGGSVFTATATDTNGNTSEFSACASVSGPCTIICPANMVVSTAANQCGAVVNFFPTTSGNCGAVTSSPPSGSFFSKGTNTVTCTTASGTNCSFTITVLDTVAPGIACPANIVTNVPFGQTNAAVNYPAPTASDNCGNVLFTNSSPPSGSLFPLGVTTVTCTASDDSGNTNTCSFTVTVQHSNAPPVAQCHNVTTNADNNCQADVPPAAVDNGSFDSDGTITNRTLTPPGPYFKGTNAVTLTVFDNEGSSNSCTASVIVLDRTPPTISCSTNITTNAPPGQTSVAVDYPLFLGTDHCSSVTTTSSPPSGSFFPLGTTTVICTASDSSGNTNTCSFTVTVLPTATDCFWTNALGGTYSVAPNWLGHLVPGAFDNANFTNNAGYQVNWTASAAAANAFFNANSGTVTQAIGGFAWTLTNSYVVGQNAGSVPTVALVNGTLRVTNAAGTAVLNVRRGTNRFDAGLMNVDQLVLTNGAGVFQFNGGTLITRGGAISNGFTFDVGSSGSTPAILDVRAGNKMALQSTLLLGLNTPGCQLLLTNGGKLFSTAAFLGFNSSSVSNAAFIANPNSILGIGGFLGVGSSGAGNEIHISNGGTMTNSGGADIGDIFSSATNNLVQVTGAGSTWISGSLLVGGGSAGNRVLVENGGLAVVNGNAQIGSTVPATSNLLSVTGTGSVFTTTGTLFVGNAGAANSLIVSNGGAMYASGMIVGANATSTNNFALVDGGTLWLSNSTSTAALDIRRGTNRLNAGRIQADQLLMTNALGNFVFNRGAVNLGAATVANGQTFVAGDGANFATLFLAGNGASSFANGLTVRSNGTLEANGIITGGVTVQDGGTLLPQALQGMGRISLSTPPVLQGAVVMRIDKNGSTLTNSQIQVTGTLTYGAQLWVNNNIINPSPLSPGDTFQLFNATSYAGSFSAVYLPALAPGLYWSNRLLVDGSIQVMAPPQFTSLQLFGTNLAISGTGGTSNGVYHIVTSTNITLPLTNWIPLLTNQFDAAGNFVFSNAITPGVPMRFYRVSVP